MHQTKLQELEKILQNLKKNFFSDSMILFYLRYVKNV